jgi:hypothetical protein
MIVRSLLPLLWVGCAFQPPADSSNPDPGSGSDQGSGSGSGSDSNASCSFQQTFDPSGLRCPATMTEFSTNATVVQDGMLSITLASTQADGGCELSHLQVPDGSSLQLEVNDVVRGENGFSALQLYRSFSFKPDQQPNFNSLDLSIGVVDKPGGAELRFATRDQKSIYARVPFVPSTMAWWQLRPDRNASVVVAAYSADGRAWTELGRRSISVSDLDQANAAIIAGTVDHPATHSAEYVTLQICQ